MELQRHPRVLLIQTLFLTLILVRSVSAHRRFLLGNGQPRSAVLAVSAEFGDGVAAFIRDPDAHSVEEDAEWLIRCVLFQEGTVARVQPGHATGDEQAVFVTQMFLPSKATFTGPPPAGKLPSKEPSLARNSVTV